jgi:hypothetical protein
MGELAGVLVVIRDRVHPCGPVPEQARGVSDASAVWELPILIA